MKAVIGNTVRLKTRCLYDCIMSRASWHSKVKMSVNAFNEIEFWRESLNRLNENSCRLESFDASDVCNFQLFCDASDVGYGGFIECMSDENQKVSIGTVFGSWTENESQKSSTWRELEAANRAVKSNVSHLNNEKVKIISDNKNVPTILHIGSRKPYLHNIAEDILNTCSENNIQINPVWKPRNENKKADPLSRLTDMDDLSIDDEIFEHFEKIRVVIQWTGLLRIITKSALDLIQSIGVQIQNA